MKRFRFLLYLLGYIWAYPLMLVGNVLFLIAYAFGMVEGIQESTPACIVRLKGRFANWMGREKDGHFTYAHTVGRICFFYRDPDEQTIRHERRHVLQEFVLGVFHPVVYAVSYLYGLARYRDRYQAYRQVILERDARKAAGEE